MSSTNPYDLNNSLSDDENADQSGSEWRQVTPKKAQPSASTGVMQNKFVLMSNDSLNVDENASIHRVNSPSIRGSRSSTESFNRFDALINRPAHLNGNGHNASSTSNGVNVYSKKSSASSLPDLSQSGSQAALQKQLSAKLKELRRSSSKPKSTKAQQNAPWLCNAANIAKFQSFLDSFDWSVHEPRLENLWASVLGNPQKFVFILLDYLEEIFLDQFPAILFDGENVMDDLPSSYLFDSSINEDDCCYNLVDSFRVKIEGKLESFLRLKLESPEFKIEDIFTSLLEIVLKSQKFKNGSTSFASVLVLSKLIKIFPFQALLSLREMIHENNISLVNQNYFYLWMMWMIFEEEPSQSNSLCDLLLDEIASKWQSMSNALILCSLQCIEDFSKETCQSHAKNCAFLSQMSLKMLNLLLSLKRENGSSKNYQSLTRCLVGIFCKVYGLELAACPNGGNCCLSPLVPLLFQVCDRFPEGQDEIFLFLSSCIGSPTSPTKGKQICASLTSTRTYDQYLGTVSKSFLAFLLTHTGDKLEHYYDFAQRLLQHTRSLLTQGRRWSGNVADQSGFTRNDAFQNADLLEKLIAKGGKAKKARKSGLRLFVLIALISALFVGFKCLCLSHQQFVNNPIVERIANNPTVKSVKRTADNVSNQFIVPHAKQALATFNFYAPIVRAKMYSFMCKVGLFTKEKTSQAVQKYRPVLHALTLRCREGGASLVRYYWSPEAVAMYRARSKQVAKRARDYLNRLLQRAANQ